jgi:hypothetical protein
VRQRRRRPADADRTPSRSPSRSTLDGPVPDWHVGSPHEAERRSCPAGGSRQVPAIPSLSWSAGMAVPGQGSAREHTRAAARRVPPVQRRSRLGQPGGCLWLRVHVAGRGSSSPELLLTERSKTPTPASMQSRRSGVEQPSVGQCVLSADWVVLAVARQPLFSARPPDSAVRAGAGANSPARVYRDVRDCGMEQRAARRRCARA